MDKNAEMMKKIIDAKKSKSKSADNNKKALKSIGKTAKGIKPVKKSGGLFDR